MNRAERYADALKAAKAMTVPSWSLPADASLQFSVADDGSLVVAGHRFRPQDVESLLRWLYRTFQENVAVTVGEAR